MHLASVTSCQIGISIWEHEWLTHKASECTRWNYTLFRVCVHAIMNIYVDDNI